MGYTVLVGGIPLRVQPDIDEIREVLPGERHAMEIASPQSSLFPDDGEAGALLRLEVAQRPGEPVDNVALYLFDERTGVTLDCEVLYRADAGSSKGASTLSLARPSQDTDTDNVYEFPADEEKEDGEG